MDPIALITVGKFVLQALEEGVPVVQSVIKLLKASDDPQAKALLAQLETAYTASRERAQTAHDQLSGGT